MEAAYILALAALAGTAIGGLTSFATSWTTQQAQARAQRLAAEREARAALFGRFLDEAAKLYSDALQNRRDDITGMIDIYALTTEYALHHRHKLSRPPTRCVASSSIHILRRT
jgi:hypothetical protein